MELYLLTPKLEELSYRKQLMEDPETMDYNAGYDLSFEGYDYETGCIAFPEEKWKAWHQKLTNDEKRYFAYVVRKIDDVAVGYVNFHYNNQNNRYECGVIIEGKQRGKGYAKESLKLLCDTAFKEYNIDALYDDFPKTRERARKVFTDIGFVITGEKYIMKKSNEDEIEEVIKLTKEKYLT